MDAVLHAIEDDADAVLVAMAILDGLKGAAAILATGLDAKAYDAARHRLIRKLTRLKE